MSTLESNSKFSLVSSGELQVCQSFILFRFQLHQENCRFVKVLSSLGSSNISHQENCRFVKVLSSLGSSYICVSRHLTMLQFLERIPINRDDQDQDQIIEAI